MREQSSNSTFTHGLDNSSSNKPGMGNSISLRALFIHAVYYWPIFIIGLMITMSSAFLYLQYTNPAYKIKASLVIQDEKKQSDEKGQLQELDLSSSSKLVENEIEVLKSRNLITQMVNDLQLWVTYKQQSNFKPEELYRTGPVTFKLLKPQKSMTDKALVIVVKNKSSFFLKNTNGKLQEFHFKTLLKSDFGTWYLEPNADLEDYNGKEITINFEDPNKTAKKYQQAIDAVLLNKTAPTIGLSLEDNFEQRGKDILNHLITLYNKANTFDKNRINQTTLDFIDKRIVSLAVELNNSEKQVESFRSSRGLTDISSQSKVYLENVQSNDNRLNDVIVQLNVLEGIDRYINSDENSKNLPVTLGISDPSLNTAIANLSQLLLQRDRLLATTPEDNPAFEPIDRQIRTTKASIKASVQNLKYSLLSTKSKLQSFNTKYESSIRDVPGQERELINKTRQQSIKENLYVYLLQKREELSLNYAATLTEARVVDEAYADASNPSRKSTTYGIAFLLGLILPAGFIYGRNVINSKITTRKDITNSTAVPILAEITQANNAGSIIVQNDNFIAIGEQFRSLRTNLYYVHKPSQRGRVTLFTSSVSGEGKSFICSNVAVSLAVSTKKTIIVELDLRRPKVAENFDLEQNMPGISEFLKLRASKEEIIQSSKLYPSLDIITSGSTPVNPSELLESNELDKLFSFLRDTYDEIIIDTPPLHLVTDALVLARLADVTLYMIRQGFTKTAELTFINEVYVNHRLPNLNIIFNGIQRDKYGYGYNYDNSYYHKRASNESKLA